MAAVEPKRVVVTGAAGQIAYSLLPLIASGKMLGAEQPVILHLLDIEPAMTTLGGVVMELEDCAYPLLAGIVATFDPNVAFKDVDVALLVGAFPRGPGMERKDLLARNAGIFEVQGKALNEHAKRDVKVLVVGNPANTNCLLAQHFAPSIPAKNFSALTRLDHNRAKAQIAKRLGVKAQDVHNVCIWGNHSATQYPDATNGYAVLNGRRVPVREAVADDQYLNTEFITTVQQRGAAVIAARKLSSAFSAANAIVDHMRDWIFGTAEGEHVSMAVVSDGSYGVPRGLLYSFPVTCANGEWSIVQGLTVDAFSQEKLDLTTAELESERETAFSVIGAH